MQTIVPTIKSLGLSLGITVGLSFAFVPLEGCGGVRPVTEIPDGVAGPIRACAVEHTRHVGDGDHTVTFDVLLDSDGQVTAIALVESTVGDEELEKCIASSIRSLTADDLLSHRSENFDREVARPESRMLLGNPALPIAACLASPPCFLALTVLAAGATYITVNIVVHSATATKPAAIATAWPMATAKPTTTTTAPPIPIALPRKYPNQTCEEEERIRLNDKMHKVCDGGFAAICGGRKINEDKLPKIPCSLILLRLQQRRACLAARWLVQDKCFGGKPDTEHKDKIDQTQNGIDHCEALELINCAKNHPMANL